MQGATKQEVNAEDMLAELKRALESSTPTPTPRPSGSMVSKSGFSGQPPQIDKKSLGRVGATADSSAKSRQPTDLQKATTPIARSWKRAAGGVALAGAALICGLFALVNKGPNQSGREPSIVATDGPVRPQSGGEKLEPSSGASPPVQDSRSTEPLQSSALEARPDTDAAAANEKPLPVEERAVADPPPQLGSFGLESAAPAFTPAPANQAAAPAPEAASLGGTPSASAPSAPASANSARPDETPKPPTRATAPASVSTESARPSSTLASLGGTPAASAPSAPASTNSARPEETPKPPARATAPASVSTEPARPSTPKIDSTIKPPERPSLQKPAKSAKTSARPFAQTERHSPQLASPNVAASSPQAAQDAGHPPPAAAPAAPWIGQRFADGMTHGFSYLAHLPGALLPHPANPNSDANPSGTQ